MAINDLNSDNGAQQNAAGAQQQSKQQGGNAGATWSFHQNMLFGAPISRGVGSEYYTKLKAALVEQFKQATDAFEISLLDLDNVNESALAFSAIIVALRAKGAPSRGVAYHVLILEATGEKVLPITENINGQQVELLRVTSDALDDILLEKALAKVRAAFTQGPWYMVDGTVVPASFNPDDKVMVHQLALNAGLAGGTELEIRNPAFEDLNLATVAHDSSMQINIQFGNRTVLDAVGNPMRSDVVVQFASRKNNSQSKYNSVNSGDKEVRVSELSGFVDLVWAPVQPQQGFNPYMMQMQQPTQKYVARLVITNLMSNRAYTPAGVLLALSTALAVNDDNNWIQTFRPSLGNRDEIDLRDIGALNIEANITNEQGGWGTRIDTKAENFKLEDLGALVASLIQPSVMISMDCPEAGPQSWYTSVFAAAAAGSTAAYNVIYQAAQTLTNNRFGHYFPNGSEMFIDRNNRIHLGTWRDNRGNIRDIRDIDHLAVANLVGERNPTVMRDWSDTFLRQQYPLPLRLAGRRKMISTLTNETAEFTGFAQRVTFTGGFLDALSKGIRDTGLPVRVNTPLSGSDFTNQRGVATFAGAGLLTQGQSFMSPGAYGGYQPQYMNYGQQGNYRW